MTAKAFLIRGAYVPASAIVEFKPDGPSKNASSWIIHALGNRVYQLCTLDYKHGEADKKVINDIHEYFGLELPYRVEDKNGKRNAG
jgi:hypothetical protein